MEENTENRKRTLSEAAEALHIDLAEAFVILKTHVGLSNLSKDSEISNWQFRVLEGIVETRAKEKEQLERELKGLSKEPPKFPPSQNAMCYCPAPPDWRKPDNDEDS